MRYAATTSGPIVRDAIAAGVLDVIVTPRASNAANAPASAWMVADNGCFGAGYPGDDAWVAWLRTLPVERVRFAVAPDVVGDAAATLARSAPWLPVIRGLGMPAALVAQDGLEDLPVPWDAFDVLFIGGDDGVEAGPGRAPARG